MKKENIQIKKSGTVVKLSSNKTVSVLVETLRRHLFYGKVMKVSQKFMVHDEAGKASLGDSVVIVECRPISRHKRWRLLEILEHVKAPQELVEIEP